MPASIAGPAWDVLGVGANSVDFVNLLPGYPRQHGTLAKMRIRRQEICCGGQMATALSTCASLGLRTKYIGVSGTDENGKRVRHALAEREVDMTDAVIRDATNQFAIILVEESTGERIVLWDRDERLNLRPRELLGPMLRMRKQGDYTPDEVLKKQWFDELSTHDRMRLMCVFDDRDKVVKMWRDEGVACFQVAPGEF